MFQTTNQCFTTKRTNDEFRHRFTVWFGREAFSNPSEIWLVISTPKRYWALGNIMPNVLNINKLLKESTGYSNWCVCVFSYVVLIGLTSLMLLEDGQNCWETVGMKQAQCQPSVPPFFPLAAGASLNTQKKEPPNGSYVKGSSSNQVLYVVRSKVKSKPAEPSDIISDAGLYSTYNAKDISW